MKFKPTVGLYVAVLAVIGLHTVVCGETTSFEENDGTVVSDNGTLVVKPDENPFAGVHAAYYLWYGNPASDGKWQHWNHEVCERIVLANEVLLTLWLKTAGLFDVVAGFATLVAVHSRSVPARTDVQSS